MADLNTNQINDVLNQVYKEMVGKDYEGDRTIDLQAFVDEGNDPTLPSFTEKFTKALIVTLAKNWFTDSSYRSNYKDPFFVDKQRYGGIIQMISCEVPDVQESHAWKSFQTGDTIGTYELFLPIIHTQYYGKTVSWELPIAITYRQWDDAVKSRDELDALVSYILMCVDNKITQHLEDCNALNRNNFIAEKIHYNNLTYNKGVHVVNLVQEYNRKFGATETKASFQTKPECLRYMSAQMKLYMSYMKKQTAMFNTAEYVRFTPNDRLVVQLLSSIVADMDSVALSTTFHDELVALPGYQEIPFWQTIENTDFDTVSAIDVLVSASGDTVDVNGIVGLIVDKWAIMHTLRDERVAVKNFDPEAINQYYYQYRDSYMNNLTMNGIVFVLADYTETTSADNFTVAEGSNITLVNAAATAWYTSNDEVATVSSGTVTGVGAGTCWITATMANGYSVRNLVTVTE